MGRRGKIAPRAGAIIVPRTRAVKATARAGAEGTRAPL